MVDRVAAGLAALGCVALGALLASNYLGPPNFATAAFALAVAASFVFPGAWLVVLPATLPILSFATHTGSMVVEEFDLVALGVFAGAYARMATRAPTGFSPPAIRLGRSVIVLLALLAGSYAFSAWRGQASGATAAFIVSASDYSPSNNFRILKGFVWALVALPLLRLEVRKLGATAMQRFSLGMVLGLLAVSLVALWERLAFAGLLELAADYRITASFWEMHVGGGALDGFLALTLPFALWELLRASRAWQRVAAAGLVALAGYVLLVTFSRALYAASAVGLVAVAAGALATARHAPAAPGLLPPWIGVMVAVAVGCMLTPVFESGGYRSLAAVCVALGGTVIAGDLARGFGSSDRRFFVAGGLVMIMIVVAANAFIDKGAYVAFVAAEGVFAIVLGIYWLKSDRRALGAALGAYAATLVASVLVAYYWNGLTAVTSAAMAVLAGLCAALYNALARRRLWALSPSTVSTAVLVAAAASIVAVTTSSYTASVRFATTEQDLAGRLAHWRQVVGLITDPWEHWSGAGLGRLPETYVLAGRGVEFPGTFRLVDGDGDRHLRLGLPQPGSGNSEPLRFEQTIAAKVGDGPYELTFEARADASTVIAAEICQRHLLYPFECTSREVTLSAGDQPWQRIRVAIPEGDVARFPAYVPRPVVFAISNASPGRTVDIRNLALAASNGRDLLRNGDLSAGMAHWFFTSDRIHLPWHAKNLWVGVWFDQGWFGVGALLGLIAVALARSVRATAQGAARAVPAAAALAAFLVVGLFDSLLNVPRIAFLFYLTLFSALLCVRPNARDGISSATA